MSAIVHSLVTRVQAGVVAWIDEVESRSRRDAESLPKEEGAVEMLHMSGCSASLVSLVQATTTPRLHPSPCEYTLLHALSLWLVSLSRLAQ